ncbi:ATP-binding domain-containing protein [uncultured Adlercreutzia sp.]|uniref:HelD family protein n=1 Tax=uncultured Adlercreutzia sp. TaxID=875803 RepID=UPI0025CC8C11|nr:ATP-binding domain-containing protein [uncultured Adlercreutzia sp.]MCI9261849.1 ATP-binding domain-containing protein [Eggerthellaceae bacterium]
MNPRKDEVGSNEGRQQVGSVMPQETSSVEEEERARLAEVEAQISEAVARTRRLAARLEAGHRETGAHLAAARGELSPEEAHLSAFELNRMDAQAASAHLSRQRLEKLAASPYFARVDFVDAEGEQVTYLGRFAFSWRNQAVVSDWRSPVASLFYDFEPGPAAFEAPAGRREGALTRKRQIGIEDGQLRYAADSSSSVRDEVLVQALSRTADAKMHDIVSSIQQEQNAIIRDEAPGTLIIQGVAGSGKTSIALHRVAYLLYRQKERLSARSIAILSPNQVFSDYISGVLPELGEEPVMQWSLYSFAQRLLTGVAKVQLPRSWADETDPARMVRVRAKGTEEFADELASWLDGLMAAEGAHLVFGPHDLPVGGATAEASWLAERFAAYAPVPFSERLDLVAGDARERAHGQTFGRYAQTLPTRRELAGRLRRMMTAKNAPALYRRFLAETGRSALRKAPASGVVEWEDAFPLALCHWAFEGADGFDGCGDVRHLVIDEMQDLSPVAHEVIARTFPCDKTILGDVNQLVDDREATAPSAVAARYSGARMMSLMRSYRSTWEITALAAQVKPIAGLEAVQRHGEEPRLVRCGDTRGVLEAVDNAVAQWQRGTRRTLGIIAKSDFLAARYAELLARDHELTLLTDETDEYPGGLVVSSVRLAKGLEFDEVVLLDVDARQYATEADRNLLYVALTRAMHRLTVLFRDEPSPLLGGATAERP